MNALHIGQRRDGKASLLEELLVKSNSLKVKSGADSAKRPWISSPWRLYCIKGEEKRDVGLK